MNGILNIYKERGFTSHDVVAKLRGILKMKKIGHTGTLDPDACGVLPVCVGTATKVCGFLSGENKTYETTLLLGRETDTQDISGRCLREQPVEVSEEQIRQVVASFVGDGWQIPPMYSAVKIDGKRLYKLAREGKIVERDPRQVCFYDIDILSIERPRVRLRVSCSKGTYIRTLCHDIGQALGCGGCMEALLRTQSGPYRIEDSITLSHLETLVEAGRLQEALQPPDALFTSWAACRIQPGYEKYMYNGNPLKREWVRRSPEDDFPATGGQAFAFAGNRAPVTKLFYIKMRLYTCEGLFFGLYMYEPLSDCYRLEKMFYGG